MIIKNKRGVLVNLNHVAYTEIDDSNAPKCRVLAWFHGPAGLFYSDGNGDIGPFDLALFTGTKEECEDYMDWLYRELDASEYTPNWYKGGE